MHNFEEPSSWVQRWSHLVPENAPVLDVACGMGRHLRWFATRGHPVTGVDRAPEAIEAAAAVGEAVCADIEHGPWPVEGRSFGAVVVTNYLWRPLFSSIVASVAPQGVLLYETFASGNETVGRPAQPAFLLQPGELLRACASMRVVAYEEGFLPGGIPAGAPERFVQRIVAVREGSSAGEPPRYLLSDSSR